MQLFAIFLLIGAAAALPSRGDEQQRGLLDLGVDLSVRAGETDEMYKEKPFGGLTGNALGLAVLEQQRKELEAYKALHPAEPEPQPEAEQEGGIKKFFNDLVDKSKDIFKSIG